MNFSMRRLLVLTGAVGLVIGLFAAPLSAEPTCRQACLLYRTCVVDHGKKQSPPRTPTKAEFEKLYAGCMKTCGLHKAKVLACYNQAKNSCPAYGVCIQRSYKK